jgi:hypothetical protein
MVTHESSKLIIGVQFLLPLLFIVICFCVVFALFYLIINLMGQLEPHGVNEMFLTGLITGLVLTYIAEAYESTTFESFKAYAYTTNFVLNGKIKHVVKNQLLVLTNDGAAYKS